MGLVGAIIVRPALGDNYAYNNANTKFRDDFLFLLTEADPTVHQLVEQGKPVNMTKFFPVYWFINGRTAPDTMVDAFVDWLPHQPYNCMPITQPYDSVLNPDPILARLIGGGREMHPYHTHGNHTRVIARDGRLLEGPGGEDTSELHFTMNIVPGQTTDATFIWEGHAKLGWDVYGHKPSDPANPGEGTNHGKPFPVTLPETNEVGFGPFYSGSPFLGKTGSLPPPDEAVNLNRAGYFFFMWHSHSEKELTNFDIFPGGMLTMAVLLPLVAP
jgi:hypothetical protein